MDQCPTTPLKRLFLYCLYSDLCSWCGGAPWVGKATFNSAMILWRREYYSWTTVFSRDFTRWNILLMAENVVCSWQKNTSLLFSCALHIQQAISLVKRSKHFELHNSNFLKFSQGICIFSWSRQQVNKFQPKKLTMRVNSHEDLKSWLCQPKRFVLSEAGIPW